MACEVRRTPCVERGTWDAADRTRRVVRRFLGVARWTRRVSERLCADRLCAERLCAERSVLGAAHFRAERWTPRIGRGARLSYS